jgi:hypothetical protein
MIELAPKLPSTGFEHSKDLLIKRAKAIRASGWNEQLTDPEVSGMIFNSLAAMGRLDIHYESRCTITVEVLAQPC